MYIGDYNHCFMFIMVNMFIRTIEKSIRSRLWQWKIIIIYGPRQVGKTTLVKKIMDDYHDGVYVTCDDPTVVSALTNKSASQLRDYFGNTNFIVIDEAQRVSTIGISLKLLIDTYPELQIIVTWSSSFELSQKVSEPLTGRKYEFMLYPLSLWELSSQYSRPQIQGQLQTRLIKGMYPSIVMNNDSVDLKTLTSSYLFKDILEHQNIRNPQLLLSLLQALALQLWSEVSYTELWQLLWVDKVTIQRYIELLEKSFVIFSLPSLSRNMRNELKRAKKIYFYDVGMRNTLINNLNEPNIRDDMGKIRENFVIMEIIKKYANVWDIHNYYFWRTHTQQEIDFITEAWGILACYECKRWKKWWALPASFAQAYPGSDFTIVNPENILSLIL